jgi:hypothetical protein
MGEERKREEAERREGKRREEEKRRERKRREEEERREGKGREVSPSCSLASPTNFFFPSPTHL